MTAFGSRLYFVTQNFVLRKILIDYGKVAAEWNKILTIIVSIIAFPYKLFGEHEDAWRILNSHLSIAASGDSTPDYALNTGTMTSYRYLRHFDAKVVNFDWNLDKAWLRSGMTIKSFSKMIKPEIILLFVLFPLLSKWNLQKSAPLTGNHPMTMKFVLEESPRPANSRNFFYCDLFLLWLFFWSTLST